MAKEISPRYKEYIERLKKKIAQHGQNLQGIDVQAVLNKMLKRGKTAR